MVDIDRNDILEILSVVQGASNGRISRFAVALGMLLWASALPHYVGHLTVAIPCSCPVALPSPPRLLLKLSSWFCTNPYLRCDDNVGEYEFLNGAKVQFYFAHRTENKTLSDALHVRDTMFEDYDIILGNAGNPPSMRMASLMESAREIRAAGVPFIWLSTYDGIGNVKKLTDADRAEFFGLGAKFIPVHEMVEGFVNLTKGVVEHEVNNHYCMPGPPNELGLLFLRIIWAHWTESHSSNSV